MVRAPTTRNSPNHVTPPAASAAKNATASRAVSPNGGAAAVSIAATPLSTAMPSMTTIGMSRNASATSAATATPAAGAIGTAIRERLAKQRADGHHVLATVCGEHFAIRFPCVDKSLVNRVVTRNV